MILARLLMLLVSIVAIALLLASCTSSGDDSSEADTGPDSADRDASEPSDQDGGSALDDSDQDDLGFRVLPPIDWRVVPILEPDDQSRPLALVEAADFGVQPDDGRSDEDALGAALEAAAAEGAVVMLPAGVVDLTTTVDLPDSVVLRGQGRDATTLRFDLGGADADLIKAEGDASSGWTSIRQDVHAGADSLDLGQSVGDYRPGDVVELEQTNDPAMYTSPDWDVDWGEGSVGEMAIVTDIDGSTVTLDHPLFSSYTESHSARIRVIDPASNIGVESLKIVRVDDGYGSNIRFDFAVDVWVSGVESDLTTRAHVETAIVYRCRISDNVLHDAHDFGDGGRAYGVSTARHTTGCVIDNNTLFDLRHALIIQLGASGNAFTYNHARGSAGYEDRQPRADISLHGHWPQANLFEGNVVDRVVFADWWGPSGPSNTLHRNCVFESVTIADSSDDQYVIGNIIGDGGLVIDDSVSGTVQSANRIQGTPVDSAVSPPSLRWDDPPDYLDRYAWPAIAPEAGNGADRGAACAIPATDESPLGLE